MSDTVLGLPIRGSRVSGVKMCPDPVFGFTYLLGDICLDKSVSRCRRGQTFLLAQTSRLVSTRWWALLSHLECGRNN